MKSTRSKAWLAACSSVSAATAAFRATANPVAVSAGHTLDYTGTVVSVDLRDHVLNVKGWTTRLKAFNLGDHCAYNQLETDHATLDDLRPGEMVRVSYRKVHGVLIADRVQQEPIRFEGWIKGLDAEQCTLILHQNVLDKELVLAEDCLIQLRHGAPGAIADLNVGDHVLVTCEIPDDVPTARQIERTSIEFTGSLTGIDLEDQTLKARTVYAGKKFRVADNCAIVLKGRPDGHLADLRLERKFVFSFDEIDGVNVVSRIAPVEVPPVAVGCPPMMPMTSIAGF
jgi:hypothetical protein